MRLLLVCLLATAALAEEVAVTGPWLSIPPLDIRGRRPFRADAVFRRYLLDRNSPPPQAGERLVGELGKEEAWAPMAGENVAYAYTGFASGKARVVMADLQGAAVLFVNGAPFVGDVYGFGFRGVPVWLRAGRNDLFVAGIRGEFKLTFRDPPRDGVFTADWDVTKPDDAGREVGPAGLLRINASTRQEEGLIPLGIRKDPAKATMPLEKRAPGEARRITFLSSIDGSVQEYSLLPSTGRGLRQVVLTLHGASVDAYNQARAYSPKGRYEIVAPTNRRPFGFDWQDWGRQDAYEVLAQVCLGPDEEVFLTGHSMGGHGTWHLAANDPDRFIAIAPSAGWCSFDTYAGGRPAGARAALWQGADGAGKTLDLIGNLAQIPTYVLHGSADDNVPVSEANAMVEALRKAGGTPALHIQEGAGHWWDGEAAPGADCVDWPPLFEFFDAARQDRNPARIDFTSADPAVDADHYWLHVHQPLEYGKPLRVRGDRTKLTTENVRVLSLAGGPATVELDGQTVTGTWFVQEGGRWSPCVEPPRAEKGPHRSGGFKRLFDRRFLLVYGSYEEMERARYDAQVWWYRGNGRAEVVSDEEFLAMDTTGRNVILYGSPSTNKAWNAVIAEDCPIVPTAKGFLLRGKGVGGSAAIFVVPRKGSDDALAGAFATTLPQSLRLSYAVSVFTSGAGLPDYAVFSEKVLESADEGVVAAGWWDHRWR